MPVQFDYETLEGLSGKELIQIQNIFNTLLTELFDYLGLEPLYKEIVIEIIVKQKTVNEENVNILDFGIQKFIQNEKLIIKVYQTYKKFLPFILLREAYYCFIPRKASYLVKICINQILENDLNKLSAFNEWKKFIRDSLVDREIIHLQLDKLQKFFKMEAKEPFENTVQFFFKEVRENVLLSEDNNIERFYDLIFERYTYKTSRSLFNQDIIETIRVIFHIFHESKKYLSLSDYQTIFKKFKKNQKIDSDLSFRKFNESMQWINKCSTIAPSYDISYSSIDLNAIIGIIKFNPFLKKTEIKKLLEEWPFYHSLKFSENSFATEVSLIFVIPKIYLNDFLHYFNKLELFGYIKKKKLCKLLRKSSFLNLNYFTDLSNTKKIIDPKNFKYEKKLEIESIIEYPTVTFPSPLSVFDFVILDRISNFSVTGLTFDKRIETLNIIKEDVENELRKNMTINREFKNSLDKIIKLKSIFLEFLDQQQEKGFLYTYSQLNDVLNYLNFIEKILNNHPEIINISQLQTSLSKKVISHTIEDHIVIQNENIKKKIFHDSLLLNFQSISSLKQQIVKIQSFFNILNICNALGILDLYKVKDLVSNSSLTQKIYQIREKRYKDLFKAVSSYKITNEKVESTIEAFLDYNPPVIKPSLISTILTSTFAKYYPILILKDTPETRKKIKQFTFYFPRAFIWDISDLTTKRRYIFILIYLINIKEKKLFTSILYSYFKDYIISMTRYFWRGVKRVSKYQQRDFYDFENKKFFYSEDFFNQLFIYSQKLLGKKLKWPKNPFNSNLKEAFWSKNKKLDDLVNSVKKEDVDFDVRELDNLIEFKKDLEKNLLNSSNYKEFKAKIFFERYLSAIKFFPSSQNFGFSQYYLYFRPFNYNKIDFKLLFKNTFQEVKYPACIEQSPALLNKYIFPFRNPNKSYLNWLVKSKKNISEFCLFYKKKIYDFLHFNRNLAKEGWNYSAIRFKSYIQNVLFNPNYDPKISGIREFDINKTSEVTTYGPDTKEFEALTQIYNVSSIDIKSYIGTKYLTIIDSIETLLKKKLIFPYLSLKNLDFEEKVLIILPDISQKINQTIIKIFSFFNFSRIYEIEGEFFIYGFENVKSFENGFLIEIWFPRCELDEFFEVFDLLFQYFEINHYLILTDLVDGKQLLKSVYGNLEFLNSYNPVKNLIWNDKDKIWMNHKLFNEKFEPIYPDLLYGGKKEI